MREQDRLLSRAFARGDSKGLAQALAAGASPDARLNETPLVLIASVRGDFAVVEQLLNAGADPNLPDASGNTALHALGQIGTRDTHGPIIDRLLTRGADVNALNPGGLTPLDFAASMLNKEMCERLLAGGATCAENGPLLREVMQRVAGHWR